MEALKFVVLLSVVSLQAAAVPVSREEADVWTVDNWQGYPLERGISLHLADLLKRSKVQQFHGLMGRSSRVSQPVRLGRRRNKGEMFVGLMGRRSLGEDTEGDWKSNYYY